jgi:hypothetical protein
MRNRFYNLTIVKRDLVDLAFAGLSAHLRDKMEGQEFTDVTRYFKRP